MEPCINRWIAYFFVPGGKICFDTFIAISCWFLIDQDFKTSRFLKMWFEVLFYSVFTTVIAVILGSSFTGFEWFSSFFPITGGVQGFAQTYLAFYLLLPFLRKISNKMTKKQNIYILIVLSLFIFLFRFMASLAWNEQSVYSRLTLFVFIYFLMLYIKHNPIRWLESSLFMGIVFVVGWLFLYLYYYMTVSYPDWTGWKWVTIFVIDEGGILFLLTGLSLFFFFKSIYIKPIKWVNMLASATFAVILIHDGHFFRGWTWTLLKTSEWYYSKYFGIRIIISAIIIYMLCTLMDLLRRNLFEKPLFKIKRVNILCNYVDKIFSSKE